MLNVLKGQLTKSMRACYNVYTIKSPPKMFNAIRATCAKQVRRIQIHFDPNKVEFNFIFKGYRVWKSTSRYTFLSAQCTWCTTWHDMTQTTLGTLRLVAVIRCSPEPSDGLLCSNASTTPVINLMKRHWNQTRWQFSDAACDSAAPPDYNCRLSVTPPIPSSRFIATLDHTH